MEVSRMKRLTVSLDDETIRKLEILAKKDNRSLSELVRAAVTSYYDLIQKEAKPEHFGEFLDLLTSREHVAVDLGLWVAITDELNEKASDNFWNLVKKVGEEYGIQFRERGINNLSEALRFLELENWAKVKEVSSNIYTLILVGRNETKLVRSFLEGLFSAMNINAEMSEGLRKLFVKIR
ncbi:MAG: CopG family transcriptional regulator [Archaeoglobales archaeon]|nr:CopG family transcriptional regulator [Archaeoglobales archaeon]